MTRGPRTWLARALPSPRLSAALFVLWLLLNQSIGAAALVMGAVLALLAPLLVAPLKPATTPMRRPLVALRLLVTVLADMITSNLLVARGVLRRVPPRARFVVVPLDLRDPAGLAVLAIVICLTPDTLWAEISVDRKRLMIHVFDLDDEATYVAEVKARYERPLLAMFQGG